MSINIQRIAKQSVPDEAILWSEEVIFFLLSMNMNLSTLAFVFYLCVLKGENYLYIYKNIGAMTSKH